MKFYIRLILFISVLSLSFFSCQKDYPVCPTVSLENGNLTSDEMDIYSAIIEDFHKNAQIHIIQQTYEDPDSAADANYVFDIIESRSLTIDSVLVGIYAKNNTVSLNLLNNKGFNLIHKNEINCMFSVGCDEGWTTYYKKYKKSTGFIKFNRPGILNDTAIVDYGIYFDCLGAEGFFVVLKKTAGVWKVEQRLTTWIS